VCVRHTQINILSHTQTFSRETFAKEPQSCGALLQKRPIFLGSLGGGGPGGPPPPENLSAISDMRMIQVTRVNALYHIPIAHTYRSPLHISL